MAPGHIQIEIPAPLVRFSDRRASIQVDAETVRDALAALHREYPELGRRLLDDAGVPRKFLVICLNGAELPRRDALDKPVQNGDRLTLLVPIAGG